MSFMSCGGSELDANSSCWGVVAATDDEICP